MNARSVDYEDLIVGSFPKDGKGDHVSPLEELELTLARVRGAAHAEGYKDGVKSAEDAFDRTMAAKLDAIEGAIATVQDGAATSEKAVQWAVIQLTQAFIEAVAPRLASASLIPEICAAIEDAMASAPKAMLGVEVAEERKDEVETAIHACDASVIIKLNPDLDVSEARIFWEGGFDQIDPKTTVAEAMKILNARLERSLADQASEKQPKEEPDT